MLGTVVLSVPVPQRLDYHLRTWLGAWPPAGGRLVVVGSSKREQPGWDGQVQPFVGVLREDGAGVLSVPMHAEGTVAALGQDLDRIGDGLGAALGVRAGHLGRGCFRWSEAPSEYGDVGQWVPRDDPRVPDWLVPFNGDVLVAWDSDGRYGAGVGRKRHDDWGQELAVVTEEHLRGRGLARALVAQAARRVLDEGAVPTYLHAFDNRASAQVADRAGFPDRGWQVLGLWGPRRA